MVLLYVYLAAFVFGAILLGASLFLGGEHSDVAAHVDVDADADAEADFDGDGFAEIWLPFASLRFWVYFLTFFGACGTTLSLLALAGRWTTLIASSSLGIVVGFSAALVIQKLKRNTIGTVTSTDNLRGYEGTVLLPFGAKTRGKVRVEVNDQAVDLVARTTDDEPDELTQGTRVLVIDTAGNGQELIVVRAPRD
ncbi:MAG: DUF1449 family protein [Deltaproteobacteria bacterium]|nr:DUF1449 family protein [Deltaproteobacteria bacterium]